MKYFRMLSNACIDAKLKYGCEFWNLKKNQYDQLDQVKIKMIKRILLVPYSTPSVAIQHELGIMNMSIIYGNKG